jgi:hypothetical protein
MAAKRAQAHREALAADWAKHQAEYAELLALEQARPQSGPGARLVWLPQQPAAPHVPLSSTVHAARSICRGHQPPAPRARPPGRRRCHQPVAI